ncbi:hypothetical protein BGZ60DRAFT_535345 [Tricladium varicosporioides]|nr:hypothetical protein BGZ60DRAFT_535345 [Hymenoscyphus varicosporioides]
MVERKIPDAFVHKSRHDNHVESSSMGLEFVNSIALKDWVVKLQFDQGDGLRKGTGFYVNIPGTQHDIIFTAGHNLIDKTGQRSQKLTILGTEPRDNIDVGDNYRICDAYARDPMTAKTADDYGIILVPRKNGHPRPGFGFCLKLAYIDDLGGEVRVTGYRDTTPPGNPIESTGSYTCTDNQIQYTARTEQGVSGSPVWVAYNGHETVVGIHNHRPESKGKGSRGTRLSLKVLFDIFEWANVGWKSKALKVWDPTAPREGLYLRFTESFEEARVRVSTDGLETTFDIIPAYTMPTTAQKQPLYIFIFKQPDGWTKKCGQWVRWLPPDGSEQGKVTLIDRLRDSCLVRIMKENDNAFRIVRVTEANKLMELRMTATDINFDDLQLGIEQEFSEVSFGKYFKGSNKKKPVKYNDLCFANV